MFRRQTTLLVLTVLALSIVPQPTVRGAEALPAADEWVPRQAVIVLNVSKPKALLDLIVRPDLMKAIKTSPAYKGLAANKGLKQFQNVIKAFEDRLQADWQTLLRRLVGGGAVWAVGPNKANLFILDALDAEAPKGVHEFLVAIAKGEAEKKGEPDRVRSIEHGGVTIWSLGPNQAQAVIGKRLMIANRPEVLKAALDLRGGSGGKSVASLPAYRQAKKAAGADPVAVFYANTGVLKQVPNIAKALDSKKNPLVALLASPVTEALSKSSWLSVALRVKGETLVVDAVSDGSLTTAGAAKFALPAPGGGGAMGNLTVPRQIAAMSLYRDLRGFYADKDDLFPERTSGLIFFENMMGIFFSGLDLTEEVLGKVGPKVRLVVAAQKYDPAIGTPATQFPAFALVLRMKDPKQFSMVMEEAWQKAVGMISFTRGQKALPGLIIDRFVHRGTKYTVAAFAPPKKKGKTPIDVRYNFRPTLAMPGDYLILSSTDALARDVMDALSKEAPPSARPPTETHSLVEIDGRQLAAILGANREALIRDDMVKKGNTREQSESGINVLLAIIERVGRVKLTLGAADQGRSKISLRIQLNVPSSVDSGEK